MPYTKVAAHGLIKKDNKFLVTHRSSINDYMPNIWDIPGGTIEFGEKAIDALNREIKEETGLTVDVGNFIFCYDFLSNPERYQFQMVYECEYKNGDVKLDPQEHDDFKWVTLDELESLPKIAFLDELFKFLKNHR
ncbi:MAG: NUDIX hydrolase [Candidatus Shapirobacteria bacterium]|nr:NUDIX hydrolase [Candidatus Shapirobacteria bacterium]